MNISERILKNAVKLGGNSLYFYTVDIRLKNLSATSDITLDGVPLTKVEDNSFLWVDGNGVTYGIIDEFTDTSGTASEVTENICLHSKNAFPAIDTDTDPVTRSKYVEVAAENINSDGIIKEAPGWSEAKPAKETGKFEPKFSNKGNLCRFSVASKDTVFHDKIDDLENGRINVDAFTKTEKDSEGEITKESYIDQMGRAIEHAREEFKKILKFQIGVIQYERNTSVIDNAFNGFYAWLLERAMGDLSRQKLDVDHYFDNIEIVKDYVTSSVTTLNSILNVIAVIRAPTPDKDELQKILEERTIDLSMIVKAK